MSDRAADAIADLVLADAELRGRRPRKCVSCRRPARACRGCGRAAELHEHVHDEWFCRPCWRVASEPESSQDADLFEVAS